MRIYFSGGSPIPEVTLPKPCIMLSYYVDVGKKRKPNARMSVILELRRNAKKRKKSDGKVAGRKKPKGRR